MKRNMFKTLDDFRDSNFFNRLLDSSEKTNTRILRSTRLENMIYNDLRGQDDSRLNEIESSGTEKLDTFPSLIHDTFQSLYSLTPCHNDVDTLSTNARQFNAGIIDHVMTSDEYPTLKSLCEGRELPAYEAVSEFSEHIFEKLDGLLETAGGYKNTLNVLNKLERQLEEIKEKIFKSLKHLGEDTYFQNADIVFLTDGECAVSEEFAAFFQNKSKQLNFSVTGIVMDSNSPCMTFSLTPFCNKVYKLSEMSCNDITADIIIKIGN